MGDTRWASDWLVPIGFLGWVGSSPGSFWEIIINSIHPSELHVNTGNSNGWTLTSNEEDNGWMDGCMDGYIDRKIDT